MTRTIHLIAGAMLLLGVMATGSARAELAIIAHPGLKLVGISKEDLKAIYLGRVRTFPNGAPVEAVDQEADSAAHRQFLESVLQMSERALKSYWAKRMFTGKAKPPQVLGSDEAVKNWVAEHSNGLGYVHGKYVDASVKVLLIIP